MDFLRLWFLGTAALVTGGLIWTFVPILVPVIAVAAGLGIVVAGIVAVARRFERWHLTRRRR